MPYVSGFLRIRKRGEGGRDRPDQSLPGTGDGDVDPDYGFEEGGGGDKPDVQPPNLRPPPGIWPPPTENHPVQPIHPGGEHPDQGVPPPGSVWPPIPEGVQGKFVVLAYIPDHGWHYIVVDGGARWPDGRPGQRPRPEQPDYPGGAPGQQPGQRPAQPQQR
jgi:hypothetical protein